jgi:Ion channel
LFAAWAASLILAFALVQMGLGTRLSVEGGGRFIDHLYMSGETFFTLGLGDVAPVSPLGRVVLVVEAGMGFGFLALVIGYVPVLYQAFSRRELEITLLDARAGSPPSAEELLHGHGEDLDELTDLLREWERWCADVLESHLSYPVLSFYRSQHDNQSWLAALTTVLDTSALITVGIEGACQRQARLTFAMARHTVVDLSQVLGRPPLRDTDRLSPDELGRLRASLAGLGVTLHAGAGADAKLAELQGMYEPYVATLSRYLIMPLPSWRAGAADRENWRTTAWGGSSPPRPDVVDPHEDV